MKEAEKHNETQAKAYQLRRIYVGLSAVTMAVLVVLVFFTDRLISQLKSSVQTNHSWHRLGNVSLRLGKDLNDLSRLLERYRSVRAPRFRAQFEVSLRGIYDTFNQAEWIIDTNIPSDSRDAVRIHLENINRELQLLAESVRKKEWVQNELADGSKKVKTAFMAMQEAQAQLQGHFFLRDEKRSHELSIEQYQVAALTVFMALLLFVYTKRVNRSDSLLESQRVQMIKSSRLSALGEMAGGIAHEVNNPLGFIKGYNEQLGKLLNGNPIDVEKAKKRVEVIDESVERISKIVKGLRTFARDGTKDPAVPVSLKKIVDDAHMLGAQKMKNMGVSLKISEISEDLHIRCREVEIGQVLLNLFSNACDAIKGLDEKWICVEYSILDKKIQIRVTDSGAGIPKELQTKVLEPFFTTKAVGEGTGMGLSISRGIVEAHGGGMFVDADAEHTSFVVELPYSEKDQIASDQQEASSQIAA